MTDLLARFAEDVFWLARYVERAESVARVLDVNETFARDSSGAQDWLPVVQLYADDARFFARHRKATASAVIDFYVTDRDNPTSIVASIRAARENARALRHLISTEMWLQLNVFHAELSRLKRRDLALNRLTRLCGWIKENCQAHTGITEGTFYRDEAWCFYQIGKHIERADQTSRLLDMRYHHMVANRDQAGVDVSQWNALLRSVAGYHAFRRVQPHGLTAEDAAAFLMFEADFPRSMANCVQTVDALFDILVEHHELKGGARIASILRRLDRKLSPAKSSRTRRDMRSLHAFVDEVQQLLMMLTDQMGIVFFARGT